ncbi:MAG TPA: lytic transglycosylase domain-containing protein [Thiomicrospira sp.]
MESLSTLLRFKQHVFLKTMSDLPIVQQCIVEASSLYEVPAPLIKSILDVEGGGKGVVAKNRNGTEDLGWAQINTVWLPVLENYRITRHDLLHDPCINIGVAAWILRKRFAKYENWEDAIASYNAGFRLQYGRNYAKKVMAKWVLYNEQYKVNSFTFAMNQ